MIFSLWDRLKDYVSAVPPTGLWKFSWQNFMQLTMFDSSVLSYVGENVVRPTAVCLEMDEDRFE
jgi:hypothetical protein